MQEIADLPDLIDKVFSACYNGIVKSKRLQKRATPAREALESRDADTETTFKL